MTLSMDVQVQEAITEFFSAHGEIAPAAMGDVASRRLAIEAIQAAAATLQPVPTDVTVRDLSVTTGDGAELLLRWYVKHGTEPGPAVYYVHGGGMILSNVSLYDAHVMRYASRSSVPFLSVDYRLAPEHPHPRPVEDCYAGLVYLHEHAHELDVDPSRISVMGDSGGGGLAAAFAILARDRGGPQIASQILIYPMLDDRNTTTDANLVPFLTWTYEDNATGWGALLGDKMGAADVPPYAAPARLKDAAQLPSAFLEIGALDIFRDETLAYAQLLVRSGVSTELHLHPAVPHAYDLLAPESEVAQRAMQDRIRVLKSL